MPTRILNAQMARITDEMKQVAKIEGVSDKFIKESLALGRVVILKNKLRKKTTPIAIGNGLRTKVCTALAVNENKESFELETDKLRVAQVTEVDCIFDITASSYIKEIRHNILSNSFIPVGTNPFLEVGYKAINNSDELDNITSQDMLDIVEQHCRDGVDFVSLNCTLTKSLAEQYVSQGRLSQITTRGAQVLFDWIEKHQCENPYYERFDELLDILAKYDVVLHLACAFKSGSISDSFDLLQMSEYSTMGELTRKALAKGVQVMSDGIGHVSIDKIPSLVNLIKEINLQVPLFVSSAYACDCAIGYDNISSSIAGSIAASSGANLLNVTANVDFLMPSTTAQLREGIISTKVAAHCGDVAKSNPEAIKRNYKISFARRNKNWKNIVKNCIDKSVFEGVDIKKR